LYVIYGKIGIVNKKNIVIAGAGFGGITAALKISGWIKNFPDYNLILLNKHNHHLYTPALYEIAAIPSDRFSLANLKLAAMVPIPDIVFGKPLTFICDELIDVKANKKEITLARQGPLPYEYLVLSLGSETNYFNIPGLKEQGLSLKTFEDAVRVRDAIEAVVSEKSEVKIIVGGGGASGVEVVAEFVNFIKLLRKRVRGNGGSAIRFILIEAAENILAGLEPWIAAKARKRLESLGIEIRTSLRIKSVELNNLTLDNGTTETFDLLFWTGGVKGPEIFKNLGFEVSPQGSVVIDEYLRINPVRSRPAEGTATAALGRPASNGVKNIFAIGDNSSFMNPRTGKPLIWNIPIAEAEGKLISQNILLSIKKKALKRFYPRGHYPYILAVGKKFAIADLIYLKLSGITGWYLKQIVEFRYLLFILPLPKAIQALLRAIRSYTSND
jgi:NADH dehydrogenase